MPRDPVVSARHYAARLALQSPPRRRGRALRVALVLIILLLAAPGVTIWLLDPWGMFEHRPGRVIDVAGRSPGSAPEIRPEAPADKAPATAPTGRPDELEAKVGTLTKEVQDLGARADAGRAELDRLAREEAQRRAALDQLDHRLAGQGDAANAGSAPEMPSTAAPPQPFPFPRPKPADIPPAGR
jgi:hypothetical protein